MVSLKYAKSTLINTTRQQKRKKKKKKQELRLIMLINFIS